MDPERPTPGPEHPPGPEHRGVSVLRGTPEDTGARASRLLAGLDPGQVLWVSPHAAPAPWQSTLPRRVRAQLGRSLAAVVLDWHEDLDADVLGQCEGLILGGGRLILRLPEGGLRELPGASRLCTFPHRPGDVTTRFAARVERVLADQPLRTDALSPPQFMPSGSSEQAEVVRRLRATIQSAPASRTVLLAERGRGKSSALGMALAGLGARAAVVAPSAEAVRELYHFAAPTEDALPFMEPAAWLDPDAPTPDVLVVDEAAQLPVPVLQSLVERHASAHLVFATTTAGYEGTGRGFSLRFVEWLASREPPVQTLRMTAPIRFAPGCPVERFAYTALLLDAAPATLTPEPQGAEPHFEALDREALCRDETLLREVFGLLVHAHYRTSPRDLHALLDAPNLRVHVLRAGQGGPVLAVNLLAVEGELDAATTKALHGGRSRLQGHALAESLVAHLGRPEAGPLRMLRSVRLATHPDARRQGLASRLVEHSHTYLEADLFGTLFGLTPELLRFRRSLGYRLVRLGASRGARTGEPSALMVRPVSARAAALVDTLERELARDLPTQLALFEAEGDLRLSPRFRAALFEGLPEPAELDAASVERAVHDYIHGPRIYESVAPALRRFVDTHAAALAQLDPETQGLIRARVQEGRRWSVCARQAGLPSVPAAMRALRRGLRALAEDRPESA